MVLCAAGLGALIQARPDRRLKLIRLSQQRQLHFVGWCPNFTTHTDEKEPWCDVELFRGLSGSGLAQMRRLGGQLAADAAASSTD